MLNDMDIAPTEENTDITFNSRAGNVENYIKQDKGYLVDNRKRVQTLRLKIGKN